MLGYLQFWTSAERVRVREISRPGFAGALKARECALGVPQLAISDQTLRIQTVAFSQGKPRARAVTAETKVQQELHAGNDDSDFRETTACDKNGKALPNVLWIDKKRSAAPHHGCAAWHPKIQAPRRVATERWSFQRASSWRMPPAGTSSTSAMR